MPGLLTLRFAAPDDRAPAPPPDGSPEVHIWLNQRGGVVARGFRHGLHHWMAWPYLATYRLGPTDPLIVAFPEPGAPNDIIWDTYRRSVLPMALQVQGWEALHASAIVGDLRSGGGRCTQGIVAFCAASGTGKSTVAFGLRRRGFPQWSDDGVVFRMEETGARALPLPFEVRLRPGSRRMFSGDLPSSVRFRDNLPGEQLFRERLPLAAVCLLTRRAAGASGDRPRVAPIPAVSAFSTMLTHAHEFDPFDKARRARLTRTYLEFVAKVPVFEAVFEPDPDRLDVLLDAIAEGLGLQLPVGVAPECAG